MTINFALYVWTFERWADKNYHFRRAMRLLNKAKELLEITEAKKYLETKFKKKCYLTERDLGSTLEEAEKGLKI